MTCDRLECRVGENAADGQATISGHAKAGAVGRVDQKRPVEIGGIFELVGDERNIGETSRFRHQSAVEIADTDMAHLAGSWATALRAPIWSANVTASFLRLAHEAGAD
jgi:hypothetical protein